MANHLHLPEWMVPIYWIIISVKDITNYILTIEPIMVNDMYQ